MNAEDMQIFLQQKDEIAANMPPLFEKQHDGVVTELTTSSPKEGLIIPWMIGGLPGSGKTILTSQEISRLYEDPRIISWQKRMGKRLRIYYLSLGRMMDLIDPGLVGIVRSAKAARQFYTNLSEQAGEVQSYALDHLPGPGVLFSDFVYVTALPGSGNRKLGTERGSVRYARRFVQSRRGRVTLVVADEKQRDGVFDLRENVLLAKEDEAEEVSKRGNVVYDLKSGKIIKYLHQRTSNQIIRERNDQEVMWLAYGLIIKDQFQDYDLDPVPLGSFREFRRYFREHKQEWTHFLEKDYFPFWLKRLYQQEGPELGISVFNAPLDFGTIRHVREKNLLRADAVNAIKNYARNQRLERVRSAVANLGIVIP